MNCGSSRSDARPYFVSNTTNDPFARLVAAEPDGKFAGMALPSVLMIRIGRLELKSRVVASSMTKVREPTRLGNTPGRKTLALNVTFVSNVIGLV